MKRRTIFLGHHLCGLPLSSLPFLILSSFQRSILRGAQGLQHIISVTGYRITKLLRQILSTLPSLYHLHHEVSTCMDRLCDPARHARCFGACWSLRPVPRYQGGCHPPRRTGSICVLLVRQLQRRRRRLCRQLGHSPAPLNIETASRTGSNALFLYPDSGHEIDAGSLKDITKT